MANSKQAIKRAKQNAETYKLRHAQRSKVRTAVKAVRASIEADDAVKAKELLAKRVSPETSERSSAVSFFDFGFGPVLRIGFSATRSASSSSTCEPLQTLCRIPTHRRDRSWQFCSSSALQQAGETCVACAVRQGRRRVCDHEIPVASDSFGTETFRA